MIAQHISRLCILIFGTLYPAYSSYKAIKNKDIKEYSRWMMYWIVFAIFSFFEVFADIFIGIWLPFYYETKILFVLWLMSPYGNGAKIMYKHLIHPELNKREQIIDSYILTAKELGVLSIWHLWKKFSEVANKMLLYFFEITHAAIFYQMQRTTNPNNIVQPQLQSQQLTTSPNFLQQLLFMRSQNDNQTINVVPQLSGFQVENSTIAQNMLSQRWLSEQTLNIVELNEEFLPSNEVMTFRSESETNLDDWEKMDVQEIDGKPTLKTSKVKKKKVIKSAAISPNSETPKRRLSLIHI